MDVNRLRQGEKIAAIAAILLFIDLFFKWFGLKVSGGALGGFSAEGSKNAFGSMDVISWILVITIIAALAMVYLQASDTRLDLPVAAAVVVTVLGGLSTLLILFRLISPPDFGAGSLPDGIDHTRKIGAFLGLILAGALTYGAWRTMEDEGTSFGHAADSLGSGSGTGAGRGYGGGPADTAPPPPPSEPAAPPPSQGEPPAPPPPPPPPPPSGPPSGV
jgi:hypothetical protein